MCKVCGRAAPNWGAERNRGKVADLDADHDDEELDDDDEGDEGDEGGEGDEGDGDEDQVVDEEAPAAAPAPGDDVVDYEWSRRKLCVDGTCTGVLGANGTCKVCGKAAT